MLSRNRCLESITKVSNRYREDVARIIESLDEHEGFVHEMGAKQDEFSGSKHTHFVQSGSIHEKDHTSIQSQGCGNFANISREVANPTTGSRWCDAIDALGLVGRQILSDVANHSRRSGQIITPVDEIQVDGYVENRGIDLYRLAKEKGLEGKIPKRKTSTYRPGKRPPDWSKIKA